MDWWEERSAPAGLRLTCVPAQHFSGRGLFNRNSTLWCGWTIVAGEGDAERRLYFVGDTGRHSGFSEVGKRCGPFDVVLMPIGAYDPQWFMRPVHVTPEDAISAFLDLGSQVNDGASRPSRMAAMHWGTFKLTDEPLDEPPIRTRSAWDAASLSPGDLWILRCGETRRA